MAGHGAGLPPACGPPASLRIDIALEITAPVRIGVDDAAARAVLLGELRLQSPPALAVAGDDDLSPDVDPAARQLAVILRHAVVEIDELPAHIAVGAELVVRGQPVGACGGPVAGDRRLRQARGETARGDELEGV